MFKKIMAVRLLLLMVVAFPVSASTEKAVGHQSHNMEKMWADMRSQPAGLAVSLAADEKGVLWLAQMRAGHIVVSHSADNGKHFSEGVAVNAAPESILAEGQNRPQIAVRNGVIAVAWSQALPTTFAGNIRFSRSADGGKTFSAPVTVNDMDEAVGHSFPALTMNDNGRIALAWIDGRDKASSKKQHQSYEGSAIYYAISDDAGKSFSVNKKLADHSCECCRVAITANGDGVPVIFWRHLFDGGVRDFAFARLDAYATVLRASHDNWQINACPHHGGDIAADEKGSLHLVWFTGNPKNLGLFYRRIDDEHMTVPRAFGNPDAQASYPAVFVAGKIVFLAWREFNGSQYQLMTMQSDDPRGERWSAPRTVATASGKTDIPEFVVDAKQPLLIWHGEADGLRVFDLSAP
ncbi:MAG: sialidase family protein [Pseudomonadales bacterium]